jgi:hypothetical protein
MALVNLIKGIRDTNNSLLFRRLHLALAVIWTLLLIPSVMWWHDSILWVVFMSAYAIIVSHVSSYQAARTEVKEDERHE